MAQVNQRCKGPWYGQVVPVLQVMTRKATPALFAITMGTGAISGLLFNFPYATGSTPMLIFSLTIFFLNLFLFVFFSILVLVKYICYPDRWYALIRKPVTSLYTGCFPMAATTLINVGVQVVNTECNVGGKNFLYFLWAMWWVVVVVSFICCWAGVHAMIAYQSHSLDRMNPLWLLPVVTLIVASSSGGVLASALQKYSPIRAFETITLSVFLVTVGLSLALMILTIYLLRLITHGLPPGGTVVSVFVPLGPMGQSGYAILLIGHNYRTLFPALSTANFAGDTTSAGIVVDMVCTCLAFILWSLGTMWFFYALLAIYTPLRQSAIPFRISFWGLVFPNCVYANLTIQLGNVFDSRAFRVYGSIYAVGTLALWFFIFFRSIRELRKIFTLREASDAPIPEVDEYQGECFPLPSSGTSTTKVA